MQGQAESYLERLHKLVETDLNNFADGETPVDEWAKFRENIIGLTDVTRLHFHKLVQELEKGLDAMLADYHAGTRRHIRLNLRILLVYALPDAIACKGNGLKTYT